MWQKYLHIFLISAFVLSSISPACAFISGKSWTEICGADGSVKTAQLDPALQEFLPDDGPAEGEHQAKPDCAFCFSSANLTPFIPQKAHYTPLLTASNYIKLSNGVWAPLGLDIKPYNAQGPPVTSFS